MDINIRCIPLPNSVHAVVLPNDDTTYDIYVNQNLPHELQMKAVKHELSHVKHGHLHDVYSAAQNELEVD